MTTPLVAIFCGSNGLPRSRQDDSTFLDAVPAKPLAKKSVWIGRLVCGLMVAALLASVVPVQSQVAASDPQALTLASKAVAALTGGQHISDVTLIGTVTRDVGTTDTGTVTLTALGIGESRVELDLSDGARTTIRDASTGGPEGKWLNPDGKSGMMAFHNTLTDSAWFFPALGSLEGGPGVVLTYIGQETRDGATVEHIRSYRLHIGLTSIPNLQELSTMDFYLDAGTLLPIAETFNTHPDNNELVNLPVKVDFSDYRTIRGVAVPTHIQRHLQGHLVEDIVVTSASFNNGVPLSNFAVN